MNTARTPAAVLVTGAAGTLGTAIVEAFAGEGWTVFAGWHRTRLPQGLSNVIPLALDVTQADQWNAAATDIRSRSGGLQVLVHAAGITRDALLAQATFRDWDQVQGVNLRGAFLGIRSLAPLLQQAAPAHVMLVSSLAARRGSTGQASYAASKAGLLGLASSLARELAPAGIRVNTVFPGLLAGPMTDALEPGARDRLREANLLKCFNEPAEVARFLLFLASTRNISGQVFNLDSRIAPG